MINVYIPSKRLLLKRKGLSGARVASVVASITKKEYNYFGTFFKKIHKALKVIIIIIAIIMVIIFWHNQIWNKNKISILKTREMFNFLLLICNSVTIGLRFSFIKHLSNHIIKNNRYFFFFYLDYNFKCFYRYQSNYSNNTLE